MRALAALAFAWLLGCGGQEVTLTLQSVLPDCPRQGASAVRVSLLGDFAPLVQSSGVENSAPELRLALGAARSLSIEGIAANRTVAVAWSGPLGGAAVPGAPTLVPRQAVERGGTVPLVYGAPGSLCTAWSMRAPRALHSATLIDATDSEPAVVLVSGGVNGDGPQPTLEVYRLDAPLVPTTLPLYEGAALGHSATALWDGTVLVAGGAEPRPAAAGVTADPARERARIYRRDGQPSGGVLYLEGGPRALHAAVRRGDEVYLLGGCSALNPYRLDRPLGCEPSALLTSVVRYDSQGNFTRLRPLQNPRAGHSAMLLPDGRILLHGGTTILANGAQAVDALGAEVYDPEQTARPGPILGRVGAAATRLPVGGVLWADLQTGDPNPGGLLLSGTEQGPLAPTLGRARTTLTPLLDGGALLAGGVDSAGSLVEPLELFASGRFALVSDPSRGWPVIGHAALPLPDGTVLLTGGLRQDGPGLRASSLVGRFIPPLRVPDGVPADWPTGPEAAEGIAPHRAARVTFDGATLRIIGGALPAGVDRRSPDDRALLAGPQLASGTMQVSLFVESGPGAALLFAYHSERDYLFVRIAQGMPVALWQVRGAQAGPVAGCEGDLLDDGAQLGTAQTPLPVTLAFGPPGLVVSLASAERLRCALPGVDAAADPLTLLRGAVGLGTLGGTVSFSALSVRRGS